MPLSLYDATVASYLQTLGAIEGFLAKGLEHCRARQIDPESIVMTRLYEDMLPFRFQVTQTAAHSIGAIEAVRKGLFTPPPRLEPDYAGLQKIVADARAALEKVSVDEVNGFVGRDVTFAFGERKVPFTGEGFLLSFSVPNFYFHASQAYGILRMKGVPLGKQDFMGRLRIKQ